MSASLVGSEMCIRDRPSATPQKLGRVQERLRGLIGAPEGSRGLRKALGSSGELRRAPESSG
eukprot:2106896-Alexandrium_andersonii.AAC.1